MTKIILALVVVIGIIAAILVFKNKPALAPSPAESALASKSPTPAISAIPDINMSASPSVNPTTKGENFNVIFTDGNVSPDILKIKTGDTVTFVNNDNISHWPASGPHPIHTTCQGFDALRGLAKEESYSFTFEIAKVCPFHDHLNPGIRGQITVNP